MVDKVEAKQNNFSWFWLLHNNSIFTFIIQKI